MKKASKARILFYISGLLSMFVGLFLTIFSVEIGYFGFLWGVLCMAGSFGMFIASIENVPYIVDLIMTVIIAFILPLSGIIAIFACISKNKDLKKNDKTNKDESLEYVDTIEQNEIRGEAQSIKMLESENMENVNVDLNNAVSGDVRNIVTVVEEFSESLSNFSENFSFDNAKLTKVLFDEYCMAYNNLSNTEKGKWATANMNITSMFPPIYDTVMRFNGGVDTQIATLFKSQLQQLRSVVLQEITKNSAEDVSEAPLAGVSSGDNYIADILGRLAETLNELSGNMTIEGIDRAKSLVDEYSEAYNDLSTTEKGKLGLVNMNITSMFPPIYDAIKKTNGNMDVNVLTLFKSQFQMLSSIIYQEISKIS